MKKVLILTVTAGNGHNSAANSMKNKLEAAGVTVKVVDLIKTYATGMDAWLVDKGYNIAVGYLRPIYDLFYNQFLRWDPAKEAKAPAQDTVKRVNGGLLKLIYDFKPDVVYATSYYCSMALRNLKRVYDLPCKTIACMLDYVISPFWEASAGGLDYMTLSHKDFVEGMLAKGFNKKQLVVTGIPVKEGFVTEIDKREAREKLGLRQDLFTVFIFYGGGHWHGGYGVLKKLIRHFKRPLQIVIVNGNDKKTKQKIDREIKKYPSNFVVKNIGFSKEVDLVMSASDVMIGKGGGLSTTESINKMLPLIATTKLPGQESYNIKFLEEKGTALTFKNTKQLIEKVNFLYDNPKELEKMKSKLKKLQTNGIVTIFDLIMSQPEADYSFVNTKLDYKKVNKIIIKNRKRKAKASK